MGAAPEEGVCVGRTLNATNIVFYSESKSATYVRTEVVNSAMDKNKSLCSPRADPPQTREDSLRPVLPFLKLLITALRNLPQALHFNGTVFRGERGCHPQFATKYTPNNFVTHSGFTSTTVDDKVLSQPAFCGPEGMRTTFQLHGVFECAYKISTILAFPHEDEVLLKPGVQLQVQRSAACDDFPMGPVAVGVKGLHSVVIKQVKSAFLLEQTK